MFDTILSFKTLHKFFWRKIFSAMCFKVSGSFLIAIMTIFSGCDDSAMTSCPIILNPLNAGQQIKLIPNQKLNEYAVALVCSSNTPVLVGGLKRCLSQAEDAEYIASLFKTCSSPMKNGYSPPVLPTGKGQARPIVVNTNSPQREDHGVSPALPSSSPPWQSHSTELVLVQSSASPSIVAQQTVVLSVSSSTNPPEVTQPVTEPTFALRSRDTIRNSFDIPATAISETVSTVPETSSTTTVAPSSEESSVAGESSFEFGFGYIFH